MRERPRRQAAAFAVRGFSLPSTASRIPILAGIASLRTWPGLATEYSVVCQICEVLGCPAQQGPAHTSTAHMHNPVRHFPVPVPVPGPKIRMGLRPLISNHGRGFAPPHHQRTTCLHAWP
jgi:hypothetical protein